MMEDSCSFAAPGSSASGSHEQRNEESVEGKNKCTACGMPVKGHLGQCGSAKCLYSLLSKVTSRVDELEQAGRARQEELESIQSLNSERQVALLETIRFQEERIEKLEDELKILQRGKKEEGVVPPLLEKQPAQEHVQFVSPANSTAPTSSTQMSTAERKPAAGQDEGSSPSSQPTQATLPTTEFERTYTEVARPQSRSEGADSGFITVKSRRNKPRQRIAPVSGQHTHVPQKTRTVASPLKGAKRIVCKPFHLSGLDPETAVEDVVTYCKQKGVNTTGCYPLPTRLWGTQTMKIFVDKQSEQVVLASDFWPDLVQCRAWQKLPPSRPAEHQPQGPEQPAANH